MTDGSYSFLLTDVDHTRAAGASLGKALSNANLDQPLIVHLIGELGAGKTTFVAGLMHSLGYEGVVRSPTYTLIEPYEFRRERQVELQVIHMDLYRLTDPSQLEELGVRDMLVGNTVLLVEWPDRAGQYLPPPDIAVRLAYPDDGATGRHLTVEACNDEARWLLQHTYSHTVPT